ncbi:MAG: MFS transporter [Minisyncoccales bacterium]
MIKVNKIVKYLILADIAFWTGWGLITPIFAIFIVDKVVGGNALVVGIATAVYWLLRSMLVFPFGVMLDKYKGERDDYLFMVIGNLIIAITLFGYVFATLPWHVYLFQGFCGIGMAMSLAGWRAIFTKNIDKGREATEWSLDDTMLSIGTAAAGVMAGWMVLEFGYDATFISAGILGLLSVIVLLRLRKEIQGVFDKNFHANIKDIFFDKR